VELAANTSQKVLGPLTLSLFPVGLFGASHASTIQTQNIPLKYSRSRTNDVWQFGSYLAFQIGPVPAGRSSPVVTGLFLSFGGRGAPARLVDRRPADPFEKEKGDDGENGKTVL
jgi:hypothetical protein